MKRIIILTLLCICNILSFAQSFKEEYGGYNVHYLQYTVMDPQALTVRCQIGPSANYSNGGFYAVVPASVSYKGIEYSVVSIGSIVNVPNMLKSISLPNTIETIEYSAFKGCTGLTEINIPSGVRCIDSQAFYSCTNLAKIQVPSSVVLIWHDAFDNTKWLSNQPDGVVYPNDKVAYGYKGTMGVNESVSIKDGIVSISESAFADFQHLAHVSFPNTLSAIYASAFNGCSLSSVALPSSVEIIGFNAFANNTGLKEVTIAESSNTLNIFSEAFASCPVEKISYGRNCSSAIFKNLNTLTEVEIGKSVTELPGDEFSGCGNLTKIIYNSENPAISAINFTKVNTIFVPKKGLVNFFTADGWKDIENIYCIDNDRRYFALYSNTSGEKLTKVNGETGNCVAIAEGDQMTISANKTLTNDDHIYLNGAEITDKLPYTTKMTRNSTLVEISGDLGQTIKLTTAGTLLAKIGNISVLPTIENLTITGPMNGTDLRVIRDMKNLRYLNIADAWFVAGGATYYSSYTTKDDIIPQYAFYKMPELRTLILPNGGTEIGTYMAAECPKLENCEVGNKVITLGQYAFADCPMLGYIDTGKATRSIGSNAFQNCSNLEQVIFGSDCATIGSSAFLNCANILKLVLPKKLKEINANTFKGCTSLRELIISENVKSIGTYAFADCSSLESIFNFSFTPQTISSNVFQGVDKNICSLTVPKDSYTDYYLANIWKDFVNFNAQDVYYIAYYVDGQLLAKHYYREGDVIIQPTIPTKEGSSLIGWNNVPDIMPGKNVTINAYFALFIPGDTNSDGNITMSDVVSVINYIMETPLDGFTFDAADMNGDSRVTLADVVLLIDNILEKTSSQSAPRRVSATYEPGELYAADYDNESLTLALSNATSMTAVQMDFDLPEGVEIEEVTVPSKHTASWTKLESGKTRLIIYSPSNRHFGDVNIADIRFTGNTADKSISVEDISECTVNGTEYSLPDLRLGSATSIRNHDGKKMVIKVEGNNLVVEACENATISIANISGQSILWKIAEGRNVRRLNAGVYIINGKKYVVK